jgi:hypothetical protein
MSAFVSSTVYHGMALLKASDGQIWRVWFMSVGEHPGKYPLIERLTEGDVPRFRAAINELHSDEAGR